MPTQFSFNALTERLRNHQTRIETLERSASSNRFVSYTPTLTASVTDPNLDVYDPDTNPGGTGSATGKYVRHGNLVYAIGDLQFGAAATAGNGTYRISLPTTVVQIVSAGGPSPAETYTALGHWRCTGFGLFDPNDIQAIGGTNYMTARYPAAYPVGVDTVVTHNQPWGWAAGYRISFAVLYEAAV